MLALKLANFACKRPFCRSVFAEWPGMTSYFLVRFYLKTVKKTELLWTYGISARSLQNPKRCHHGGGARLATGFYHFTEFTGELTVRKRPYR